MHVEYDIAIQDAAPHTVDLITRTRKDGRVYHYDGDKPFFFEATARFPTFEAAQEFAAQFPRSVKMKALTLTSGYGPMKIEGYIKVEVKLSENGVNKGINETGIRRIRTLALTCQKLGVELVQKKYWGNCAERGIAEYGWLA